MLRVRTEISGFQGGPGLMTQYFFAPALGEDAGAAQLGVDRVRDSLTAARVAFASTTSFRVLGQVDRLNEVTGDLTGSFNVIERIVTGNGGANDLPIATALCVIWNTADFVNGRRVIGKTFLSPLSILAAVDANGTPTAALLALATAFADSMLNQGATGLNFGVWHRPVAGAGGAILRVESNRVSDVFAVLRSRRD